MSDISERTNERSGPISLANEDEVKDVIVRSVLGLWTVVNDLTRLRPARRGNYRVTIFGSARAQAGTFLYEEVKRVAQALAEMGCDISTGGGPGLMRAANEGAAQGSTSQQHRSVGIRVDLPFEQQVNPFVTDEFEHQTFFTRLHHFVLVSDAFIVMPGGIGTVLEMTLVWQLLQVRHVTGCPLIVVGKMWRDLIQWARSHLLQTELPLINEEDLAIPVCVDTADEAIALLRKHHTDWQQRESPSFRTPQA